MANPRNHPAVIVEEDLGKKPDCRWDCPIASTPVRDAKELAKSVSSLLENCSNLHLIDPHFNPAVKRYRVALEELLTAAMNKRTGTLETTIHCAFKKDTPVGSLKLFEKKAFHLKRCLPKGVTLYFKRWNTHDAEGDWEKFHNRYILTDLGGVIFGTGLDDGRSSHTEDINLLSAEQYYIRWKQFVVPANKLELVDCPLPVKGEKQI